MDLGIAGRVALVTGASRGIGLAAARALAAEGCAVAVASRRPDTVRRAAEGLAAGGARAVGLAGDVADPAVPARLVAEAEAALGPVDILVANAGGPRQGGFLDVEDGDWERAAQQNLLGMARLARAVLPGMQRRRWGRIVTITSMTAREAADGLVLSNAVRAGVAGMVRTLAREVAAEGFRVNNVMPGPIDTERLREIHGGAGGVEAALAARAARNPTGRLGRPDEVGDLVAFLCGERAAFLTGASILVDGGESRVIA
ncbi:MAG: SDR family oxidoreductase [Actinomycetota bacterium]